MQTQSREDQPLIGFVYHSKSKLDEVQKLFVDSLKRFEFVNLAKHNKSSTTTSSKTTSSKRKQGLLEFENNEKLEKELLDSISTVTNSIVKETATRYSGLIFEFRFLEFEQHPNVLFLLDNNFVMNMNEEEQCQTLSGFLDSKAATLHIVTFYQNLTEKESKLNRFSTKLVGTMTKPTSKPENSNASHPIDLFFRMKEYQSKSLFELGEHLCLCNSSYLEMADILRAHNFEGVMEIHIFISPVNPDQTLQQKFKADCASMEMKSCNLRLDFVKSGLVGVLMSSRYFRSGMKAMWQECFRDARRLASLGYDVIRAKIEASASIDGVPENDVEAQLLPAKTYFEFHMVFRNGQDQTPTDEECEKAKQVAKRLEKEWKVCIPLSMNAFGTQRFLNMRTYGIGREKALPQLENLGKELQNIGFKIPRFIREFGVYDSEVAIDCGWLEPEQRPSDGTVVGFLPPIQTQ